MPEGGAGQTPRLPWGLCHGPRQCVKKASRNGFDFLSRGPPLASLGLPRIVHESKVGPVKARVYVTLKNGVLDPQGKAIQQALGGLGFSGVGEVRQGKVIELELAEKDREKAHDQVASMCERLLANTVIENYDIELDA